MPEKYERDNREEVFDEEYVKRVEARRRRAKMRRAQQEKNIIKLGLIGGAIILVLIIILIAGVSCSTGKDEEVTTPVVTETPTEATTTAPEETTLVTMYTTDVLNLRAQPNTNAEIIIQIGAGKRVDVISEEGKWCKVKRGKDEGYVMKKYLSYMNNF